MIFNKEAPENWNNNIKDFCCTKEFAEANMYSGEVYFACNNENKALVVIKKKYIKVLARAQIFTDSLNKEFLIAILVKLKDMKIPYARIGNTMFGVDRKINLNNSKIINRHTFILDLNKTEEEIWKNFNKKLRNVIRKSEKESVKIFELKDEDELKEYYNLSLKTEKNIQKNKGRKTFSIQSYDFFKELFNNKLGRFLIAKYNNKIIAGALFLIWNNKSVYFQSCSDREYSIKQAPSLIQWESIKRFKQEGVKEYDLGGVTINLDKNDSRFFVYEFKRKFNGELKEFYNIEIELNKFKKVQDALIKIVYE